VRFLRQGTEDIQKLPTQQYPSSMVRNDTEIPHPSPLLIKEREKEKAL
jgi:hypothetical protein